MTNTYYICWTINWQQTQKHSKCINLKCNFKYFLKKYISIYRCLHKSRGNTISWEINEGVKIAAFVIHAMELKFRSFGFFTGVLCHFIHFFIYITTLHEYRQTMAVVYSFYPCPLMYILCEEPPDITLQENCEVVWCKFKIYDSTPVHQFPL